MEELEAPGVGNRVRKSLSWDLTFVRVKVGDQCAKLFVEGIVSGQFPRETSTSLSARV